MLQKKGLMIEKIILIKSKLYFFDNFHGSVILNSFTYLKNNYYMELELKIFVKFVNQNIKIKRSRLYFTLFNSPTQYLC